MDGVIVPDGAATFFYGDFGVYKGIHR
jgi:hypothetical protein